MKKSLIISFFIFITLFFIFTNTIYATSNTITSLKEVLIIPPTQTRYDVGEKLNLDGLKITAIYDNNIIEEVKDGYTIKGYNRNKEGLQTVTISYKGFSRSYNVKVGNIYDVDLDNTEKLPQTGDFFDLQDGLYLLAIVSSIILICIVFKSIKHKKSND